MKVRLVLNRSPQIFLYSHDTFGLGHLRRNRKIALAVRNSNPLARITLATGSDAADRFPPIPGVDLVHLPPVVKQPDGHYTSPDLSQPLGDVLQKRSAILCNAVLRTKPDIFIADKEPLGLLGELDDALSQMPRSTHRVLGLRDILDEAGKLKAEWQSRGITTRISGLYDEVWIYGPRWFHEPLNGLDLPSSVLESCRYVGFLGTPDAMDTTGDPESLPAYPTPYILVTAGGGEDGINLMRQVLAACHSGIRTDRQLLLLPGPLMASATRSIIADQAMQYPNVQILDFHADLSSLIAGAGAVVAMCGYNTFCEVIEAGKPALFIPRETPRREQLIRAERAAELGVASVMRQKDAEDAATLASRINDLESAPRPASGTKEFMFDGLDNIGIRVAEIWQQRNLADVQG